MKRVIFIVHSSEIVRCGLTLMLRKYFNIEIAQLSSIDELGSYTHSSNKLMIIFIEAQLTVQQKLINKLKNNNVVHLIGIGDKSANNKNINLLTSSSNIQQIVSEIINVCNNETIEISESTDLTAREKDVLKLVAIGHSSKEIADQLFISIHTVISHRKNITEKLGIKSISGLTVYAILNKLIDTKTINPEDLI